MKKIQKTGLGVWLLLTLLLMGSQAIQAAEMNVRVRTPEEIQKYIRKSGATVNDPVTYKIRPRTETPFKAGALSDRTLQSALKIVNQIRYIAGLDADVTLDPQYTAMAQAAALVNAANGQLSHYPQKPAHMNSSLFKLGSQGASSSNLALRYSTLGNAIVNGWMYDGDDANIDRVGHRRWILNPPMKKTGFGHADDCSALYAFDWSGKSTCTNVVWPAQNMPLEYFNDHSPWSISTDQKEDLHTVRVTMFRRSDQKKWTFSERTANGYFHVDNGNYGQTGCIIFRPQAIHYQNGDCFDITITGTKAGKITYTVNFFSLTASLSTTPQKPKPTNITKLTAAKKGFTLKWKKQTSQTTGYEIAYSTSKKFPKKNTVTVKVRKNKTVSQKLTGLKARKKYYVKIRTYKSVKTNGKTVKMYSVWSKVKSVITKK